MNCANVTSVSPPNARIADAATQKGYLAPTGQTFESQATDTLLAPLTWRKNVTDWLGGPVCAAWLMGANISACAGRASPTGCCIAAAVASKVVAGHIKRGGWLLLGATGTFYGARVHFGPNVWTDLPVAAVGVALCLKTKDGLAGWPWLYNVRLRPDAALYTSRIEIDKVLVGAAALLLHQLDQNAFEPAHFLLSASIGLATIAGLIGAGCQTGFVRFDPHPPGVRTTLAWAAVNLLLVAASEEALFRGVALRASQEAFSSLPAAQAYAVVATALVFGLAHKKGGTTYMALSSLAGIGYGAVVALTGRIEAGIALHFTLNISHFLLFTYPNCDRRRSCL